MNVDSLLSTILLDGNQTFYAFSNVDGKQWLMPAKHLVTAMNLYQPSSLKGRVMKNFFPYFHRLHIIQKKANVEKRLYSLDLGFKAFLCRRLGVDKIDFSIFCGTPCVHQKITIQLSYGSRILGYVKLTDNEMVKNNFRREKKILDDLERKGMNCVPRCLFCGTWKDNIDLFIQTTNKTNHSFTDHQWNKRETAFIQELHNKTKLRIPFESTDFFRDLSYLNENISLLKDFDLQPVKSAINRVMRTYATKEVNFSFCHADFTPWNIYIEKGKLYAFDFEYAKCTYPPYLDYFHFITQTAIFENHLDAEDIMKIYQKQNNNIKELLGTETMDLAYLCYLLTIISHYVQREKNEYSQSMMNCFRLWIHLITLLEKK
jgi:hypothetical protein